MSTTLSTPITPQYRTIDGLKIRFAESESEGDLADRNAELVTGWRSRA